jgi:hypothetical protein
MLDAAPGLALDAAPGLVSLAKQFPSIREIAARKLRDENYHEKYPATLTRILSGE